MGLTVVGEKKGESLEGVFTTEGRRKGPWTYFEGGTKRLVGILSDFKETAVLLRQEEGGFQKVPSRRGETDERDRTRRLKGGRFHKPPKNCLFRKKDRPARSPVLLCRKVEKLVQYRRGRRSREIHGEGETGRRKRLVICKGASYRLGGEPRKPGEGGGHCRNSAEQCLAKGVKETYKGGKREKKRWRNRRAGLLSKEKPVQDQKDLVLPQKKGRKKTGLS